MEQYRDNICPQHLKGNTRNRIRFVKELAQELPLETMWLEAEKKRGTSEKVTKKAAVDPNTADAAIKEESLDMENFKLLLKNNFFTPILKNESDFRMYGMLLILQSLSKQRSILFHHCKGIFVKRTSRSSKQSILEPLRV